MKRLMENFRRYLEEGFKVQGCRDESRTQEDAYEKVNDEDVRMRTTTIVKKCRLVPDGQVVEEDEDIDESFIDDSKRNLKQRERDKVKRKEREVNPLVDLNEPFLSLGSGIMQEDELDEKKEKKSKPHCVKGNVYHSKEDGQFTDKENAGSWSLQWSKDGSDCQSGVSRMKGRKAVVQPCGRANKDGGKSDAKCGTKSKPKKPKAK